MLYLRVGGIPVLVTIYGFIQEPVFRYIKNGNTGIPKYPVYRNHRYTHTALVHTHKNGVRRASIEREDQIARTRKIANHVLVYTSPSCTF